MLGPTQKTAKGRRLPSGGHCSLSICGLWGCRLVVVGPFGNIKGIWIYCLRRTRDGWVDKDVTQVPTTCTWKVKSYSNIQICSYKIIRHQDINISGRNGGFSVNAWPLLAVQVWRWRGPLKYFFGVSWRQLATIIKAKDKPSVLDAENQNRATILPGWPRTIKVNRGREQSPRPSYFVYLWALLSPRVVFLLQS